MVAINEYTSLSFNGSRKYYHSKSFDDSKDAKKSQEDISAINEYWDLFKLKLDESEIVQGLINSEPLLLS